MVECMALSVSRSFLLSFDESQPLNRDALSGELMKSDSVRAS